MPENRNSGVRHSVFHHARQEGKMIVLNQDDRMFLAHQFFRERVGESRIHFVVVFPVRSTEDGTCVRHVAERPQTLVGKTVVVAFLFFRAKPNATQRISRIVRRNLQPVMPIDGLFVGSTASLGDPSPVASAEYRLDGGYQAAGWDCDRYSVALPV